MRAKAFITIALCLGSLPLLAADWPSHRANHERSGYTADELTLPLVESWSRKSNAPRPAWPTSKRLKFDFAAQPIVADGRLFIGSSATGGLSAVDATSGKTLWTFYTNGPIRFAPAVQDNRVYVVSDDGRLYCLDAKTGKKNWSRQGGPSAQMCLGNGRLISRWPARGGPVLFGDTVYFAAGIWPSDGFYLYALDATTGNILWSNDSSGGIHMGQPHGGAYAESGVIAQGHLVADKKHLYIPTGRAVPAVFDRETGEFKFFHLQANSSYGGSVVTLSNDFFINGGGMFERSTGKRTARVPSRLVASTQSELITVSGKTLSVSKWQTVTTADRKGKPLQKNTLGKPRTIPLSKAAESLIVAGNHAVTGSVGFVTITDLASGKTIGELSVEGTPLGLAVAGGTLFVSTTTGHHYSFGQKAKHPSVTQADEQQPTPETFRTAAQAILQEAEVNAGYCVDLNCDNGYLAQAIAEQSGMHVVAVTKYPEHADAIRERLLANGLYGSRVSVVLRDTTFNPLPDYMANLVVSSRSLTTGADSIDQAEADRLLRPWGGVLCAGKPDALTIRRRGALEGAGNWTHQYGNPQNTACSDDTVVSGSLGMLWYGDMRQQMTQRHGRAPAPLVYKGIIYSEGLHGVIAVDAYTGRKLWEIELPNILKAYDGDHLMGTSGTGGNYCVADSGVYVRLENKCLRIDRHTGKILNTFTTPTTADPKTAKWGYISVSNGVLVGSIANDQHVVTHRYRKTTGDMKGQLTESSTLFALDASTGELKWKHKAAHSIRHNAIAIGDGKLLFIDKALADYDRNKKAKAKGPASGRLIALNLQTGKEQWQVTDNIYGTTLAVSVPHQTVVMGYQPSRFGLASEIGGRMGSFDLKTGAVKWEKKVDYASRIIINNDTIYAQGAALDLISGSSKTFNFKRSYGCGALAASRDLMVFRSATLGYFDFNKNDRVRDFGGIRPGCWINVIPANGLVLAPDASSGCKCSYLNKSWIALQPNRTPERPTVSPAGGSFKKATAVTIEARGSVHYTLDGTTPTTASPRYLDPIEISEDTRLKCLTIDWSGNVSPVKEIRYTINPHLLSTDPADWQSIDTTVGTKETSNWISKNGAWNQTSNIYSSTPETLSKASGVERPGTFLFFKENTLPPNREISLNVRSGDNDGIGIAFDFIDENHYTLLSLNAERKFRTVLQKNGDEFKELSSNNSGYAARKWHAIRILQNTQSTQIFIDEKLEFDVLRTAQKTTTIALHTWGNSDTTFKDIQVRPLK